MLPVCFLLCDSNFDWVKKPLLQWSQKSLKSPVCLLMCDNRLRRFPKRFSHCVQGNSPSSEMLGVRLSPFRFPFPPTSICMGVLLDSLMISSASVPLRKLDVSIEVSKLKHRYKKWIIIYVKLMYVWLTAEGQKFFKRPVQKKIVK